MTIFTEPHVGESPQAFQDRREDMIQFVQRRHRWARDRAIAFLEHLNHVGLAYIGVDMREEAKRERSDKYDPFRGLFTVL